MRETKVYDKLVRDRIPEIIAGENLQANYEILNDEDYGTALFRKFFEEAEEYRAAESPEKAVEELSDIVEVILATVSHLGVSPEEFERLRLTKRAERGGFERRILLKSVEK
jgi:predicted house-cleaning noncanonical NTP pyrophosphatase (MazG superfamily)